MKQRKSRLSRGESEEQLSGDKPEESVTEESEHGEVIPENIVPVRTDADDKERKKEKAVQDGKKKKKRNLWPLKAFAITFLLSAAVNAASELVLEDSQVWLASILTLAIVAMGVFFDMIGTAATSCDIQPFLSMASRKVKGAKTAVRLAKNSDVVSSVCNDIIGDICGVVSGVCAATIAASLLGGNFWITVLIYAAISTLTITAKAVGKGYAVNNANKIVFNTAKILSIFSKEG